MVTRRRRIVSSDDVQSFGADIAENAKVDASGDEMPDRHKIRPGVQWSNVTTDTLRIADPAGVARRLREELTLGDDRVSYGIVIAALDKSASNYELAGRLYRAARSEERRFEHECSERVNVLREAARVELMSEYNQKLRKSPTKDDVEARIVENWPDEYASIKGRLNELHNATQALEVLRDAWSSRCADLRIMANRTAHPGG